MILKIGVATLAILAVVTGAIAMLIPRSKAKGRMRLAGSLLIGFALILAFPEAKHELLPLWRASIVPAVGAILIWLGIRKYHRDPEGRTPPAQIL